MERLKNNKNLIYVILIGIGLVAFVLFSIWLLIFIWSDDNTTENTQIESEELNYDDIKPSGKVGIYNDVSWSVQKQVNYYTRWICDALKMKNINRINELISPEYLEYYNLDNEKLIALLENKGMWGKELNIDKYEYVNYKDNKVFKLHVYSDDKTVDDYINLIEYTPKKVTISFDSFVTTNKEPREYIRDNIKYTFSNEIVFDTRYKVDLKISNDSSSEVILNKNMDYENIYLNFSTIDSIMTISTVFAGETITVKPNSEFNTVLEFTFDDLAFGNITSMTFEDITFMNNGITKDVEIEF